MSQDPLSTIATQARGAWAGTVRPRLARRELARRTDPLGSSAAKALGGALRGKASPEEREWIERIEAARGTLERSQRPIEFTDFGAGAPASAGRGDATPPVRTTVADTARLCSKPPRWCLVLFRLLRENRPQSCLELGTCVGISAAYEAAALKLNGGGRLVTLEGADALAETARETLAGLALDNAEVVVGRFQDTLAGVLADHASIDYAFVDGHHDEAATVEYFDLIAPHLSGQAIVVFDDIAWSRGMARAWRRIAADGRVAASANLGPLGLVSTAA